MPRIFYILLTCMVLQTGTALQGQMLHVDGKEMLINGINIPWRHFGQDFGTTRHQHRYDTSFYNRSFQRLQEHGVNAIRMWIHCDGRNSPLSNREGVVSGLPRYFLDDLDDFLMRAARYDLMVIPVLWTFEMVDKGKVEMIRDVDKTQLYLDLALRPIIDRTRHHCNILAWEVINEPEWAMDIPFGGTTDNLVTAGEMQRFVGLIAQTIHERSPHRVTVGAAGLRFLTDMHLFTKNYWHDHELQAQNLHCRLAYLDFYTVHYYKWTLETLSPFKQPLASMGLGKPVLLSEFGLAKRQDPDELMQKAIANGYAGIMPWSMMANDEEGNWEDYRDPLKKMSEVHADLMPHSPHCLSRDMDGYLVSCLIYPNPATDQLIIESHATDDPRMQIDIISPDGRRQLSRRVDGQSRIQFDISGLVAGLYIVRIAARGPDGVLRVTSRQKLMVAR